MRILRHLSPRTRKIFDWIVGLTFIIVGIILWIMPIVPGWFLIVAGFAVLSSHSRWAQVAHDRLKSLGRAAREKMKLRRKREPKPEPEPEPDPGDAGGA